MNKKSKYFFITFISLSVILFLEVIYLQIFNTMNDSDLVQKNMFVKTVGLPDLAISTETSYIRHRSLSDIFSIYSVDGSLREYSKSSYANTSLINE